MVARPSTLGTKESNPSSLKLCSTSSDPIGRGEGHLGNLATSIPWAESRTIWARRQVTTDPDERRTIAQQTPS